MWGLSRFEKTTIFNSKMNWKSQKDSWFSCREKQHWAYILNLVCANIQKLSIIICRLSEYKLRQSLMFHLNVKIESFKKFYRLFIYRITRNWENFPRLRVEIISTVFSLLNRLKHSHRHHFSQGLALKRPLINHSDQQKKKQQPRNHQ